MEISFDDGPEIRFGPRNISRPLALTSWHGRFFGLTFSHFFFLFFFLNSIRPLRSLSQQFQKNLFLKIRKRRKNWKKKSWERARQKSTGFLVGRKLPSAAATVAVVVGRVQGSGTNQNEGAFIHRRPSERKTWRPHDESAILNSRSKYAAAATQRRQSHTNICPVSRRFSRLFFKKKKSYRTKIYN